MQICLYLKTLCFICKDWSWECSVVAAALKNTVPLRTSWVNKYICLTTPLSSAIQLRFEIGFSAPRSGAEQCMDKMRLHSHSCMSRVSYWGILPLRYRCNSARSMLVYLPVLSSFSVLTCALLLFPPLRARKGEWVTPTREPVKPLVCDMSVYLSVCLLYVCLSPCLFTASVCQHVFIWLQIFVLFCQFHVTLLTCIPACQWMYMHYLVLCQTDTIPQTTQRTVLTL